MPLVTVVPNPRDQPRLPVVFTPRADRPCNYESTEGQYYEAIGQARNIWFRRADWTTPLPWQVVTQVTATGKDSWPWFSRDFRKRWTLVWTHTDSGQTEVRRALSDDDGRFWSTPTVAFASGRFGFILDDPHTGTHLEAAWVAEQVQALRRRTGDPTDTSFAFQDAGGGALLFANTGFCISVAREGPGRWVMVALLKGRTDYSRLASANDGESWEELPT